MDSLPISRRRLLGGGCLGLLSVLAGCNSLSGSKTDGTIESWTPEDGNWPLSYYDLQNRSFNPNASPPQNDVEITRSIDVDVDRIIIDVLVADDYVVVCGYGLQVLDRDTLEPIWGTDGLILAATFGPPDLEPGANRVLYYATEADDDDRDTIVRALRLGADGVESQFSTRIEGENVASLLPTKAALFVGSSGIDLVVVDPKTGDIIAEGEGRHFALREGALVTTTYGQVSEYEFESGGLFSDLEMNPVWEAAKFVGRAYHPAVVGDRVLVGSYSTAGDFFTAKLFCFDFETGESIWEPRTFGWATSTPAIGNDMAYVAGDNPGDETGRIAGIDLDDGSIVWDHGLDWQAFGPIVAGDDIVIVRRDGGYQDTSPGYVEAYDGKTGDSLWSIEFDDGVIPVRPVGERLYVGAGETLHVLESV